MSSTLDYYLSENHCYNGDRDDIIHNANSKNVVITVIVIIINSTIINIISFFILIILLIIITTIIVVIMVSYSSRCYVLLDFWY